MEDNDLDLRYGSVHRVIAVLARRPKGGSPAPM